MPSSFLGLGGERRARSKSPGPRKSREDDYHTAADRQYYQPRYSAADFDSGHPSAAPLYEERTPDAYEPRPSADDRRRSTRGEYFEDDRRYSRQPARHEDHSDDERRMRPSAIKPGRDVYVDYPDTPRAPKSPRPGFAEYTNGNTKPTAAPSSRPTSPHPGTAAAKAPPSPKPGAYANVGKFEYAKPSAGDIQYKYGDTSREPAYAKHYDTIEVAPPRSNKPSVAAQKKTYNDDRYNRKPESDDSSRARSRQDKSPRRESYTRERSPNPAGLNAEQLRKSLGRLSTSGAATLGVGTTPKTPGARPPGSPLLEAYKGTYQTISPLPSPLALALRKNDDDDISDLEVDDDHDEIAEQMKALQREKQRIQQMKKSQHDSPRSSGPDVSTKSARSSAAPIISTALVKAGKPKKAVTFYDPQADAEKIAEGLKGSHRSPDVKPLLKIMPWLTTDEIIHLKQAYKSCAKVGGQGINLSKHIKARLSGNLCKIVYATSLGQYESDAYWANCFYQSGASRRELLIESLVGRSNQQIREIKDVFKDKRYDDDLEKCMKAELKADKFRMAILLCLEEQRMPEGLGLDMKKVHEDGLELYQALNNEGGESAMIHIILTRSNDHLKEVMRYYEKSYGKNFAREMIRKSQNLVVSSIGYTFSLCTLTVIGRNTGTHTKRRSQSSHA